MLKSYRKKKCDNGSSKHQAVGGKAYQLEPRILFDAAAPAVIVDAVQSSTDDNNPDVATPDANTDNEKQEQLINEIDKVALALAFGQNKTEGSDEQLASLIKFINPGIQEGQVGSEKSLATEQELENPTTSIEQIEAADDEILMVDQLQKEETVLVVVDATVTDYEALLENIGQNSEVIVIGAGEDGFAKITGALAEMNSVASVHIISHGSEGAIYLGGSEINADVLAEKSAMLNIWSDSLTGDADILLYGCSVAENDGQQFTTLLGQLTDADIAASNDATGSKGAGGNWVLEEATGEIEAPSILFGTESYEGLLAVPTLDVTETEFIVFEDTDLSLDGITVGDVDGYQLEVKLTTTDGIITLSSTTNLTVISDGTDAVTIVGGAADINTALSGVTFRGVANFNGNTTIDITVKNDPDNNGDFSDTEGSTGKTLNIGVVQTNDDPTLAPTPLSIQEGGVGAFSAGNFGLADVDIDTGEQVISQQIMQIICLPEHGQLHFNGSPVVVGSSFSYADIANLIYTHNGSDVEANDNNTDKFTVNASDGAGGETGVTNIDINLTPKNVAPTMSSDPTVYEGQTIDLGLSWADEESAHADSAENSLVTISEVDTKGEGALFFDANNNNVVDAGEDLSTNNPPINASELHLIKFQQNGNEPQDSPAFKITITDNGGGEEGSGKKLSTSETITINLIEVNDDPTLVQNADGVNNNPNADGDADNTSYGTILGDFFDAGSDGAKVITTTDLQVEDVDTLDVNLVYVLESQPTYGRIEVEISPGVWAALANGGRFTQDQVDNGDVRFNRTSNVGADNTVDSFSFKVYDSELKAWQAASDNTGQEGAIYDGNSSTVKTFTFNILLDPWTGTGSAQDLLALNLSGIADGNSVEVYEGQSNVITNALINYTSEDTTLNYQVLSDEILFRIIPDPATSEVNLNGVIEKNIGDNVTPDWVKVTLYDHFTQEDIDNGYVRFSQNAGEDFQSHFTFSVTDGANAEVVKFYTNTVPINDRPDAIGGVIQAEEAVMGDSSSGTVLITDQHIGMSDADGATNFDETNESNKLTELQGYPDSLWFSLRSLPTDGVLQYYNSISSGWETLVLDNTYDDPNSVNHTNILWFHESILTNGNSGQSGLRYVHGGGDGPANLTDLFTFYVRDDLPAPTSHLYITNTDLVENVALQTQSVQPDGNDPSNYVEGNHLSDYATVNIEVVAFNDPSFVPANYLTTGTTIDGMIDGSGTIASVSSVNQLKIITEGQEGVVISSTDLFAVDSDNTTIQRQFKVTDVSHLHGTLMRGTTALGVGSTFTQQDINDNLISYAHDGSEAIFQQYGLQDPNDSSWHYSNAHFSFVVNDGLKIDSGRFDFRIDTPANDIPTVAVPNNQLFDFTGAFCFTGANSITIGDSDLTDIATGETDFIQVTVTSDHASALFSSIDIAGPGYRFGNGTETLTLGGSLAEVRDALDAMSVEISGDQDLDQSVKITVTADDRLRNSSGALTDDANGGNKNDADTEEGERIDDANNIVSDSFILYASNANNTPILVDVPGGPVIALEDTWSEVKWDNGGNYTYYQFSDADTFDTNNNSVTIEVRNFANDGGGLGSLQVTAQNSVNCTGNYTDSITITGSLADVNATLETLMYRGATDFNDSENLRITYSDNGNIGAGGDENVENVVQIDVIPKNDIPDVAGPSDIQYVDGAGAGHIFNSANGNAIIVSDAKDTGADIAPVDRYTVTLKSASSGLGYGSLALNATAIGALESSNGDETDTLTLTGTLAQINAALDGLKFTPAAGNPDITSTITVTVDDLGNGGTLISGQDGSLTDTHVINLVISSENNTPTSTTPSTPLTTTEDTTLSINGGGAFVFADSDTFSSSDNVATIIVTKGTVSVASAGSAIVAGSGTGTATVTGTLADINATLELLQYTSTADINTVGGAEAASISVTYEDGGNPGGDGIDKESFTVTRDIDITPVNDAPTRITTSEVSLPAQNEDTVSPPSQTINTLLSSTFSDAVDQVTGGTGTESFAGVVVIGNAALASEGVWQYSTDGSNWNDISTLVSSNAGLVIAKDVSIRFLPAQDFNGDPGKLTVRLVENNDNSDAGGTGNTSTGTLIDVSGANSGGTTAYSNESNQVEIAISITSINDSPTTPISSTTVTVTEDNWSSIEGGSLVSFGDVDTDSSSDNSVQLSVGSGGIRVNLSGSATISIGSNESDTLTITGSLADINATLASLEYRGNTDLNGNGADTLTAVYDDQGNNGGGSADTTVTVTRTINIAPVNDAPIRVISEVTLPNQSEDEVSVHSVDSLLSSAFDDSKDDVTGGTSADDFTSIVIVANSAMASEGTWQYHDGSSWVDISTSLDANNGLLLNKDTNIRFNPAQDFNGEPGRLTVHFVENDDNNDAGAAGNAITGNTQNVNGSNSGNTTTYSDANNTVVIKTNVLPVNDPPVNSVPSAQNVDEDSSLEFSADNGNAISVSDPDVNETPSLDNIVQVTVTVEHGVLDVIDGQGAIVNGDNSATVILTGTLTQINNSLDGMVYSPETNYIGSDLLTIKTNDLGNTGLGGSLQDVDTVAISVNLATDDPPTADPFYGEVQGGEDVTVVLHGDDIDGDLQEMEIRSLPDPASGTLHHPDGVTLVEIGDIFTPEDAAQLIFRPKGNVDDVATFNYIIRDSVGHISAETPVEIIITSSPAAPELPSEPEKPSEREDKPMPPSVKPSQGVTNGTSTPLADNPSALSGDSGTRDNPFLSWFDGSEHNVDNWFFLELSDQTYEVEQLSEYQIPAVAIHHTHLNADIKLTATQIDGSPLPHWISFDEDTRTFRFEPPADAPEELFLKVKAVDEFGNESVANFVVHFVEEGIVGGNVQEEKSVTEQEQQQEVDGKKDDVTLMSDTLLEPQQSTVSIEQQLDTSHDTLGKPGFDQQIAAHVHGLKHGDLTKLLNVLL